MRKVNLGDTDGDSKDDFLSKEHNFCEYNNKINGSVFIF